MYERTPLDPPPGGAVVHRSSNSTKTLEYRVSTGKLPIAGPLRDCGISACWPERRRGALGVGRRPVDNAVGLRLGAPDTAARARECRTQSQYTAGWQLAIAPETVTMRMRRPRERARGSPRLPGADARSGPAMTSVPPIQRDRAVPADEPDFHV